jgi:hypothetical protein
VRTYDELLLGLIVAPYGVFVMKLESILWLRENSERTAAQAQSDEKKVMQGDGAAL